MRCGSKVAQRLRDLRSLDAPVAVALPGAGRRCQRLGQALLLRLAAGRWQPAPLRCCRRWHCSLNGWDGAQMLYLSTQSLRHRAGAVSGRATRPPPNRGAGSLRDVFARSRSMTWERCQYPRPRWKPRWPTCARCRRNLCRGGPRCRCSGAICWGCRGAAAAVAQWSELLLELSRSLGWAPSRSRCWMTRS